MPSMRLATSSWCEREELGELVAREEGKTLLEELERQCVQRRFSNSSAPKPCGSMERFLTRCARSRRHHHPRAPLGVVGLILPWNFPIAIPAWKVAPALAYGNSVVFKPAELVPATAHVMSEIIVNAGIPDGVFNLVMGSGSEVGTTIVNHQK